MTARSSSGAGPALCHDDDRLDVGACSVRGRCDRSSTVSATGSSPRVQITTESCGPARGDLSRAISHDLRIGTGQREEPVRAFVVPASRCQSRAARRARLRSACCAGCASTGVYVSGIAAPRVLGDGRRPPTCPWSWSDVEPPGPVGGAARAMRRPARRARCGVVRGASGRRAERAPTSLHLEETETLRGAGDGIAAARRSCTSTTSRGGTATSGAPWSKQFREVLDARSRAGARSGTAPPLSRRELAAAWPTRCGRPRRTRRSYTRRLARPGAVPRRAARRPADGGVDRTAAWPPTIDAIRTLREDVWPRVQREGARSPARGRWPRHGRARARLGEVESRARFLPGPLAAALSARAAEADEGQGARGDGERCAGGDDLPRAPRGSSLRTASSCSSSRASWPRLPPNCSTTARHAAGARRRPHGPTSSAAMRRARRPSRSSSSTAEWRAEPAGPGRPRPVEAGDVKRPPAQRSRSGGRVGRRSH